MRTRPTIFCLLCSFCLWLLAAPPGLAQSWRGTVRGDVTDASGAPLAKAGITVHDAATGLERRAVSSDDGTFAVVGLAPGDYSVTVSAAGHKTWRGDLQLLVNEERRLRITLAVGDVSEVVEVVAAPGTLREIGPLGATIGAPLVQALPLDGRNFLELSLLAPGTAPSPQGSASSVRGDFSFTANGAREDFNSYLLDGADNVDPKLNTVAVRPAVDAIREFEVSTNAYDAAFGRYAGAQVNVVTRAGTNGIKGTAYGFVRDRALDGSNVFALEGEPSPEYQRQQLGASAGGPVREGRTFFFADYEASRRREGLTRVTTVPTNEERSCDFSRSLLGVPMNPLTGQPLPFIPSFAQHPVGRALANLYPAPNRPDPRANFVSSPIERDDTHQFDVRVDHAYTGGGALTLRYSFQDRRLFEPFGASQAVVPGYGNDAPRRGQNLLVSDARAFTSQWLNDARLSFTRVASRVRQEQQGVSLNRAVGLPELSGDQRDWGLSYISVLGVTGLGHEINNPQDSTINTWQLADTVTWSRGTHLVKMGAEARFIAQDAFRDVLSRGQLIFTGQISGNPLADLLLGTPVTTVGARLDNPQHLRTESAAGFVQDNWQPHARVTVNAGVRYEFISPPVDRDDRANLYDVNTGTLVQVGTAGMPRAGSEADTSNIAPRVGVSWTPRAAGSTVVRAGYGLYYSQSALAPGEALYFSPPYYQAAFYFPLPGLPLTLSDPFPSFFPLPSPPSAFAIQRDLETPALQHWNVGVQQRFADAWSLEVAYAGSRGANLIAARDINQPAASAAPLNLRPNPFFSDVTLLESRARSKYHALQTTLERRVSGLSLLATYTLSSSKDDASGFFASAGDANFPQDSRNPAAEWGRSSFDVRHRASIAFVYDLPFTRYALARDWQVSGIVSLQSGRPFTVALLPDIDNSNTGRSSLGFGANDRPNVAGDATLDHPTPERWFDTGAFSFPAFGSFGNAGRNILEGPGYANVNVAVIKSVPLGSRSRLQIRAEFFNLLDRANYNLPDNFLGSPTFGQILSAQAPRRVQCGARLLF